jgi:hypothetical protein
MTTPQRLIRYIPTGQVIDVGRAVSRADYAMLANFHGEIHRGDNVLECLTLGGDPWLYVYQHESGVCYARHFPGGTCQGPHRITPKSDEHLRAQDYTERAYDQAGLAAAQEVATNNRTRLDVATLDSPRICGFEVQLRDLPLPTVKSRTTRSMRATAFTGSHTRPLPNGVLPVWFSPTTRRRNWLYHVPTIEAQDTSWKVLPASNAVAAVGVRRIEAEKCTPDSRWPACPRSGRASCGDTHPLGVLVPGYSIDAVASMVATGQLVPLRYFTGYIYLVDPASSVLYAELGGRGEYVAGAAMPSSPSSLLGPCRSPRHQPAGPHAEAHTRLPLASQDRMDGYSTMLAELRRRDAIEPERHRIRQEVRDNSRQPDRGACPYAWTRTRPASSRRARCTAH